MRNGLVAVTVVLVAARLLGLFTVGFVTTGSMEPVLPAGSVFVGLALPVAPGDIVVYRTEDGTRVVHRALAPDGAGWVTKGDANAGTDQDAGLPPSRPYAVVPVVAGAPFAVREAWLKPVGLVVAETVLVAVGLKGFLEERRRAGRSADVRPHHVVLVAAAVALAASPFLEQDLVAHGPVTVGASVMPTLVRVHDDRGVTFHDLAPFTSTTVDVEGDVEVVRAADLPGARALSAHGAVAASAPLVLLLAGIAGALRWAGC